MQEKPLKIILSILRYFMALMFLWPFFDKLLGLGFSTAPENAWIRFGSPTAGFLTQGATGPFTTLYNTIGGKAVTDWMKIATISGSVFMFFLWSATLPKPNNIFQIDQHMIYLLVLLVLLFAKAGQYAGLGRIWANTKLVKRLPGLE
jgi:thiosulfate dehydrogenase [quinone] large subunit